MLWCSALQLLLSPHAVSFAWNRAVHWTHATAFVTQLCHVLSNKQLFSCSKHSWTQYMFHLLSSFSLCVRDVINLHLWLFWSCDTKCGWMDPALYALVMLITSNDLLPAHSGRKEPLSFIVSYRHYSAYFTGRFPWCFPLSTPTQQHILKTLFFSFRRIFSLCLEVLSELLKKRMMASRSISKLADPLRHWGSIRSALLWMMLKFFFSAYINSMITSKLKPYI